MARGPVRRSRRRPLLRRRRRAGGGAGGERRGDRRGCGPPARRRRRAPGPAGGLAPRPVGGGDASGRGARPPRRAPEEGDRRMTETTYALYPVFRGTAGIRGLSSEQLDDAAQEIENLFKGLEGRVNVPGV